MAPAPSDYDDHQAMLLVLQTAGEQGVTPRVPERVAEADGSDGEGRQGCGEGDPKPGRVAEIYKRWLAHRFPCHHGAGR